MAKKRPKTALYFTTLAVTQDDFAILGGHFFFEGQEPSVTRFLIMNKGVSQFLYDFDEIVYATEKKPAPPGKPRDTLCIMGRRGKYRENVSGEKPVDAQLDVTGSGYLLDLRYVGKHLYTCGTQNIVQMQDGKKWVKVDQGTFKPIANEVDRAFNSIDGFSEDDLYGVGLEGAIWHYDGKKWKQIASPTNYDLEAVLCSSSGDVYIAAGGGFAWKGGRKKGWTDISDKAVTDEAIWDMVEFQGRVYMAGHDKLLASDGGPIVEVEVPLKGEKSFMTMDTSAHQLWVAGDEHIFQFDGKKWERHVPLDNA